LFTKGIVKHLWWYC